MNLLIIAYLFIPVPQIPDLPNSIKSDEPGDTVQLKNVQAYYTNLTRTEVMNFYQAVYTGPFRVRVNHPPEKSKQVFKDTMQSYYLEEFILPFKQSLYVNGFEWENDVFTKPDKRAANKLLFKNKEYKAKISIRTFPTSIPKRIATFLLTEFSVIFALFTYKNLISKND